MFGSLTITHANWWKFLRFLFCFISTNEKEKKNCRPRNVRVQYRFCCFRFHCKIYTRKKMIGMLGQCTKQEKIIHCMRWRWIMNIIKKKLIPHNTRLYSLVLFYSLTWCCITNFRNIFKWLERSISSIKYEKKNMIFYCYRPMNMCVCVVCLWALFWFIYLLDLNTSPTIFGHEWLIPIIIPMIVK